MDLKEIKDFFEEVDNIPIEKKEEITKFLFGVSLLSSSPDKLSDLLFSNRDFEELYQSFVASIKEDNKLLEKEMILKRVDEEKELIEKIHKYYVLKTEISKVGSPLGLYGTILQRDGGIGSTGFFLLMSMFAVSKNNIPPESLAIDTSKM